MFDLQGVRSNNKNVHCSLCMCAIIWFIISILPFDVYFWLYFYLLLPPPDKCGHNINIYTRTFNDSYEQKSTQMQICNFQIHLKWTVFVCQSIILEVCVIFWQVLFSLLTQSLCVCVWVCAHAIIYLPLKI